jgi:hypothetical protein
LHGITGRGRELQASSCKRQALAYTQLESGFFKREAVRCSLFAARYSPFAIRCSLLEDHKHKKNCKSGLRKSSPALFFVKAKA